MVTTLTVAVLTALLSLALARMYRLGPVDDAYISLRYAMNWASGHGLIFNTGERVEGYSNFLLVTFETLAVRLGADPEAAMKTIGWSSLAALSSILFLFIKRHVLTGGILPSTVIAVAASLNLSLVCWAASGLESCLYAMLILASVLAALGFGEKGRPASSSLLLVLAALTRLEAVALVPVLAGIVYLRHCRIPDVRRFVVIFLAVFGVYFVTRWLYYGYLFPNPFYAKLDYGSGRLVLKGLLYVWDFVAAAPLLFLLAVASLLQVRRSPLWVRASLLVLAMQLAVVVYEGGDHLAMFRFMTPSLPFLSVLALHPLLRMTQGWRRRRLGMIVAASTGLIVIVLSSLMIGQSRIRGDDLGRSQMQRFALEVQCAKEWSALGRWLREAAPPDATLATIAIGAIGFHSRLTIIDPYGIVDPLIAHRKIRLGKGYAGHEKFDVEYVLSKRPHYLLLENRITLSPIPSKYLPRMVWGSFNREMIGHPHFAALYRYYVIRLGPRAFLNLHVRRDLPPPS